MHRNQKKPGTGPVSFVLIDSLYGSMFPPTSYNTHHAEAGQQHCVGLGFWYGGRGQGLARVDGASETGGATKDIGREKLACAILFEARQGQSSTGYGKAKDGVRVSIPAPRATTPNNAVIEVPCTILVINTCTLQRTGPARNVKPSAQAGVRDRGIRNQVKPKRQIQTCL